MKNTYFKPILSIQDIALRSTILQAASIADPNNEEHEGTGTGTLGTPARLYI